MKSSLMMALISTVLFAQESGTVVGRVTNSATGFGIPGVAVELRQDSVFYQATTDESGAFRLNGVRYGDYRGSRVEKAGYERHDNGPFMGRGGVQVQGPDPVRWDIQMDPWTILHGHVVDADGKPAAKVHVRLVPSGDNETLTDQSGAFAFQELKPGSYTLLAKPAPKDQIQDGVRVEAVPTYFPSTVEISQTEKIVIRGGVDLPDYEIRLRTSPVYHIRGVVLNTVGKPAANASVKLMTPGGQGMQGYGLGVIGTSMSMIAGPALPKQETEEISGEDGTFEFPSVQPGDWRIEASADPIHDTAQDQRLVSAGGTSATVGAHDVEDLEIRLSAPFYLEFSSDWGDAQPPQDAGRVRRVMLLTLDGQPQPEYLDAESGRFAHILPGRYRIMPPLPAPGFYVASMLLGGREVLGQEVELTPGSPPLRIVYKTNVGGLRGTVEKGEGATVVLLSQEPNVLDSIRTVKCGPGGAFDTGGVPPGDYYAAAFDRVETLKLLEAPAALIRSIRSSGVSAHVDEGAATSVQLHVTGWPL